MKKLITIIVIGLLLFSLYKVTTRIVDEVFNHNKDVVEDINKSKEVVAKVNANQYINSINLSLEAEMFNGDIIDGEYKIDGDKIVKVDNDNIFYEIAYRGASPSNESRIFIENDRVKRATLYIDGYKIEI